MGLRELQAAFVITAALVAGCEDTPGGFEPGESEACIVALGVSCERFEEAYLKASNTDEGDQFGRFGDSFGVSIAVDGDTLAVGAFGEASAATGVNGDQANNDARGSGAVYVFTRSGTTWRQEAYLKASNTDESDSFGVRVALDGDTLAVGAEWEASAATGVNGDHANNDAESSGAVYVRRIRP